VSDDETGDADEGPDQAYRLLPVRDPKAGVDVSVMVVKACTTTQLVYIDRSARGTSVVLMDRTQDPHAMGEDAEALDYDTDKVGPRGSVMNHSETRGSRAV
jgi:hypothetical protein